MMVGGTAVTPMKRVPILANFEEWMKMATDNKINATNSWNFALIDYFHDMSLLKEGDGVNFQKASCTLDGCVKIYTSRVDSVATETGKLLSGLADSGNSKKKKGENEEGEESEEEVEDEDGVVRKKPKKRVRSFLFGSVQLFCLLRLPKIAKGCRFCYDWQKGSFPVFTPLQFTQCKILAGMLEVKGAQEHCSAL